MTVQRNRNVAVSVGTASVEISPTRDQEERVLISIVNTSTGGQTISLAFGQEAAAGSGVVLYPGGFYQESRDTNKIVQEQISAISSLAGGTVAVSERIEMRGKN